MSDILLERIAVALEKIASGGPVAPAATQGASNQPASATVGAAGSATVVTADTLLRIVQPLVQDEATKVKVKEVLTKYNLNRLGEAQESQYPQLYAEFVAISGGAPAPAPAADEGLI